MSLVVWHAASPPLDKASDPEVDAARSTTITLVPDAPPVMAENAPDQEGTIEVDPRVDLGLANRSVSSLAIPGEKFSPPWIGQTETGIVSGDEIPDAGYAAEHERAGEFGHGTMTYLVGIAPALEDGHAFGGEFFASHERPIQENDTAGEYGIQPWAYAQGDLARDSAYAADAMIRARHAAETGEGYSFDGLWD